MPLAQCFTHCWSGCQHAKKGQRPPQLCPGEDHDQSQSNPSPATAADRALLAGKQTLSVMPAFADFASPAPLQGCIHHDLSCPSCLHKRPHQDSQQLSTHFSGRPARTVEDMMEETEVRIAVLSHLTQCRCDGPASACQSGADEKQHYFSPRRCRKQWLKMSQNSYNGTGKGHRITSWLTRERFGQLLSYNTHQLMSFPPKNVPSPA